MIQTPLTYNNLFHLTHSKYDQIYQVGLILRSNNKIPVIVTKNNSTNNQFDSSNTRPKQFLTI